MDSALSGVMKISPEVRKGRRGVRLLGFSIPALMRTMDSRFSTRQTIFPSRPKQTLGGRETLLQI